MLPQKTEYIGKVSITRSEPAQPDSFYCWLRSDLDYKVEIGSLLVVEGKEEKIIATIEELKVSSLIPDIKSDFFGHNYGNPDVEPNIQPAFIREAKLRVLFRSNPYHIPPSQNWKIRLITKEDLDDVISGIPEKYRITGGFLKIGENPYDPKSWYPLPLHAKYLIGDEGAHVNISGITGIAAKTSYALFLAYNILAWAREQNKKVAIVLFNVKRRDFLELHKAPSNWDILQDSVLAWSKKVYGRDDIGKKILAMWESLRDSGIDITTLNPKVRYFTYVDDPMDKYIDKPIYYSYGLTDLTESEIITALFGNESEPSPLQVNLIVSYLNAARNSGEFENLSFEDMMKHLDILKLKSSRKPEWLNDVGEVDYRSIEATKRRLRGFLDTATRVVEKASSSGAPIKFEDVEDGFNVVQLYRLRDTEKKLVVNAVLRELKDGLEKYSDKLDGIVVIMDELNLYAPKRTLSPVKEEIVDIAARGRDLTLSLIGIEQFASDIDSQVYNNCATKVVGKNDEVYSASSLYAFLGELKNIAPHLDKGQLIIKHPTYVSPMLIYFPPPPHKYVQDLI